MLSHLRTLKFTPIIAALAMSAASMTHAEPLVISNSINLTQEVDAMKASISRKIAQQRALGQNQDTKMMITIFSQELDYFNQLQSSGVRTYGAVKSRYVDLAATNRASRMDRPIPGCWKNPACADDEINKQIHYAEEDDLQTVLSQGIQKEEARQTR